VNSSGSILCLDRLDHHLHVCVCRLPGKAGTVVSPQSVPPDANLTAQQVATIGLGTNGYVACCTLYIVWNVVGCSASRLPVA
jgi:hypothetical protein